MPVRQTLLAHVQSSKCSIRGGNVAASHGVGGEERTPVHTAVKATRRASALTYETCLRGSANNAGDQTGNCYYH